MKKKLLAVLLAVVLTAALLAGCKSQENVVIMEKDNAGDKTKLTFFGNKVEPENVEVIEEIMSEYMQKNKNVSISYESVKGDEYFVALGKRMNSGNGDDIFMVNHDTVLEYSAAGYLEDLSGLPEIGDFSELAQGQMYAEDGKIYYVPTTISAFGLYCNTDLLKEYGQEVPENYKEFTVVCDYFVEKGITPVVANNDISLKTLALAVSWLPYYQDGSIDEVYEEVDDGKRTLSSVLKPGFEMAQEFVEKGYVDAETAVRTEKTKDDLEQFEKGENPFMLTGAWASGRIRENVDFTYEIHPYPVCSDGSVLVVNADTRLSVNKSSTNKEEAVKFIRFFLQKENLGRFVENQSSFSPMKDGENPRQEEIMPLFKPLNDGRSIIGADEKLDIKIWNVTKTASEMLLQGESWDSIAAFLDDNSSKQ